MNQIVWYVDYFWLSHPGDKRECWGFVNGADWIALEVFVGVDKAKVSGFFIMIHGLL